MKSTIIIVYTSEKGSEFCSGLVSVCSPVCSLLLYD